MMRVSCSGEHHIILSTSYDDTAACVRAVRRALVRIRSWNDPAVVSLRPGLDCVAIEIADNCSASLPAFQERLQREMAALESGVDLPEIAESQLSLRVPVCYDPRFAADLDAILEQTGLSASEVADIHCSVDYDVWMVGFMPGFPYIGKLPEALRIPRKSTPTPRIASGSVAIAEEYTGVYPFDSPGGWHVIGRTPWKTTDYQREHPCLFEYGMKVRFDPVTIEEFEQLSGGALL